MSLMRKTEGVSVQQELPLLVNEISKKMVNYYNNCVGRCIDQLLSDVSLDELDLKDLLPKLVGMSEEESVEFFQIFSVEAIKDDTYFVMAKM